jgi:predicted dehydrogenase
MNLTPEQKEQGQRNFLRVVSEAPGAAMLLAPAISPVPGGPVRAAMIGPGGQGRALLAQCRKEFIDLRALCDINPRHNEQGSAVLEKSGFARPRFYEDWREMLEKEDLEAVIIATPLWTHSEIATGCLDAGKHVLCEKMMAWDIGGCRRMIEASAKNRKLLEIGHQRFYNPIYRAAFDGLVKTGGLGDLYHVRLVWHRNASWRREEEPPSPEYNPSRWGYPTWEHLLNWRMYKRYSQGLMAELASHQVAIVNWFFDSSPIAVYARGGVYRYVDGREVSDHIYVTYEYPGGRTVTFSSIQSNKFDDYYECYMGTKRTLVLHTENQAYLFDEREAAAAATSPAAAAPAAGSGGSRPAGTRPAGTSAAPTNASSNVPAPGQGATPAEKRERPSAYQLEVAGFCDSIRTGAPLRCGSQIAMHSAVACIKANESAEKRERLLITPDETV